MNWRRILLSLLTFATVGPAQQTPDSLFQAAHDDLDQGRYAPAIEKARRSIEAFSKSGNQRRVAQAQTVAGLAELYLGDYASGLRDLEIALQFARDTHDLGNEVGRLNDIGSAFYFQGLYGEAMDRYQQAARAVEANQKDEWSNWGRQITQSNIAILYQTLGQNERALDIYGNLQKGLTALPPREQAQVLTNIGVLRRRLGDPRKALETYRAAQALYRQAAHRDGEIAVLNAIGIVQAMDFHDSTAAAATFTSALDLAESSGNRPLALQARLYRGEAYYLASEKQKSAADFALAASGAHQLGGREEEWKALYGLARVDSSRSRELLNQAVVLIEALRDKAGSTASFLANKRAVYDMLVEASTSTEDAFHWMEQSRGRVLRDKRKLGPPGTLKDFAAAMPADTAVLEFWMGAVDGKVIWISRAQRGLTTLRVPAAIETLPQIFADSAQANWRNAVQPVADKLLSGIPIFNDPAIKRLIIIPDGTLARIPFEALPLNSGSLLIERYAVSYSSAASLIPASAAKRQFVWPWESVLTAFADPAPGGTVSDGIVGSRQWPRLPEANREVAEIAHLSGARSRIHAGADAKKEWISTGRMEPAAMHFATHGFADLQNPQLSYLLLAPASASRRYDYLFLKEVNGLRLQGVDLVTLSACETEAGKIVGGEGVESFSQAFLSTGVQAVVTSLWRVGDKPAAELMIRLYQNAWSGKSIDDSLREAKLDFLSQPPSAHPAYWAAFTLYGDGAVRLPLVIGWSWIISASIAVIAVAYGIRTAARRASS